MPQPSSSSSPLLEGSTSPLLNNLLAAHAAPPSAGRIPCLSSSPRSALTAAPRPIYGCAAAGELSRVHVRLRGGGQGQGQGQQQQQPGGGQGRIDITDLLQLPQNEAAARLHMSNATFSKRFRQANDNKRWPFRALQGFGLLFLFSCCVRACGHSHGRRDPPRVQ